MASRTGIVAFAAAMIVAGAASAAGETSTAEARLAWATKHVEMVCKPLEAKQMFDKATRCYNDVARIVESAPKAEVAKAAVPKAAPKVAAAKPAAQPAGLRPAIRSAARKAPATRVAAAPRKPAPVRPVVEAQARPVVFEPVPVATSNRCQGIACLKRYTLLGISY